MTRIFVWIVYGTSIRGIAMLVLNQGKTLTPGDLGLAVRDGSGCLIDPVSITYTIFSVDDTGTPSLASAPKLTPGRTGTGLYWVTGAIPSVWMGQMKLVWYLQQYADGKEVQIYEEFEVVRVDPATTSFEAASVLITSRPGINKILAERIVSVRELLSDENPDRNYHFRPPTEGRVVAGFNDRVGFIWTDRTIVRMLRLNIQKLNTWNPMGQTNYTVENAPPAWAEAMALGAAASCLGKEAARWIEEEFSYSLNGVALDINKAAAYQGLAAEYNSEFTEWAPLITANRPAVCGLRQNRWLLG